jgi:UDP-3-O-[3-hydroxymyristoyl] N-acetylglucosamine deacetylase
MIVIDKDVNVMIFQTTINFPVSCYGFGMHGGKMSQVTFKPSKEDSGIVFIRTDIKTNNVIKADYSNVFETTLATTLANEHGVKIATVEHLMAALYSCKIDNIIIEIDGPEVPIMDGSSRPFIFMLECAGIQLLTKKKKHIKILKELVVEHNDTFIRVSPSNNLKIETSIEFDTKAIGKQYMLFDESVVFNKEIASARTFGFINDLKYLNSKGLALGVTLQNAIGIDENNSILTDLRFEDEFVRHKILDSVGDFYTAGNIIGHFRCHKTGHYMNNQILRKIFSDQNNYVECTLD